MWPSARGLRLMVGPMSSPSAARTFVPVDLVSSADQDRRTVELADGHRSRRASDRVIVGPPRSRAADHPHARPGVHLLSCTRMGFPSFPAGHAPPRTRNRVGRCWSVTPPDRPAHRALPTDAWPLCTVRADADGPIEDREREGMDTDLVVQAQRGDPVRLRQRGPRGLQPRRRVGRMGPVARSWDRSRQAAIEEAANGGSASRVRPGSGVDCWYDLHHRQRAQ